MNELALFAGAGGGILGGRLLGWRTRCAVEIDSYARSSLIARQRDGSLESFPVWDDINTFDGRPWRGSIDVISGGFPCQDISSAGRREGIAGNRSGLWFQMLRVVGEVEPRFVFAENSPYLRTRGLGTVIEGLTSLGYDVRWCVLGARHLGALHQRNRMWILASNTNRKPDMEVKQRRRGRKVGGRLAGEGSPDTGRNGGRELVARHGDKEQVADAEVSRCEGLRQPFRGVQRRPEFAVSGWWTTEPDVGRVAHGLADRVDRLKAIGNGQVPIVAAAAWTILSDGWIGE